MRRIRRHEQELQAANELLETGVRERTQELADQRNLLRTLIDHLPDGIFVKNLQSRVVIDNLAHARIFGCSSPKEAVGKCDHDVFPREMADRFRAAEEQLLKSGNVLNSEELIVHLGAGQTRWVRTTKVPLRDAQGKITGLAGINRDITEQKKWESEMESLHKQLLEASRHAGMAEVATSVLHNVGNVLNSLNISASLVQDRVRKSAALKVAKVTALMKEHEHNLAQFLSTNEKGRQLIGYLEAIDERLVAERSNLLEEMDQLGHSIEHIKEIVAMQQSYAKVAGVMEDADPVELLESAIRMHEAAFQRHTVEIIREYTPVPKIFVDRHKVIQILINLLHNAKYACDQNAPHDRRVTARMALNDAGRVRIEIADNGVGIPPENLTRIFSHGFTTRKNGHGFGLHSGALAATELGGSLNVQSAGAGKGATFILELLVGAKPGPQNSNPAAAASEKHGH